MLHGMMCLIEGMFVMLWMQAFDTAPTMSGNPLRCRELESLQKTERGTSVAKESSLSEMRCRVIRGDRLEIESRQVPQGVCQQHS